MKKLWVRFGAVLTLALAAVGCVNEEPGYVEPVHPEATDTGFLTLADMHVVPDFGTDQNTEESPVETIASRADAANPTGVTRGMEVSSLDDYRVVIQGRKGPVFKGTYGDLKTAMGDTGLEVPVDTYTITATSNASENGLPDGVQSEPSYGGEKGGVSVGKEETASAGTIVCKLQNIKITLSIAADLYDKLDKLESGEKIEASIYYGDNTTVRWDVPAGWDWTLPDPAPVYFPVENPDGYNKLHISFFAKLKGSPIPMNKDISDILKGQWRRIHVVQTYDTDGNLTFDAEVSAFVQDETITVGDGGVSGISLSELRYEDPSVAGPSIRWADGSDLPEAIVLGGGALQNVVLRAPNGIEKVALEFCTTNPDMAWYAGGFNTDDLCAAGNPALGHWGIPYGSDLAGRQQAEFDLHKLAETIASFDGEYSFTFTVTDRKGLSCKQTLRFIAGNVGPTVKGVGFDIDTVLEVSPEGMVDLVVDGKPTKSNEVNVKVYSDAGIDALWVAIISEELTPMLGDVGIPETFNLCELDEDMVEKMTGFGFPCNAQVLGTKELDFRISEDLMVLLKEFGGDHRFELRVADANGETTKAILLHVDK